MTNNGRLTVGILTVNLAGASLLYLASLTSDSFGYYHDDGIYVVTAKALATGQGYRIVSLPYEPAQTKYPPFYPVLLSLIWRVDPQFPQNLFPMMLFSVVATIAFLTLTWLYLTKEHYATGWLALMIVALTAINWRTIILATGIYSEMVYSALSIAGLWLAEACERKRESWFKMAVVGMVLGLAFLTRASGISLMIAVISFYLFHNKFREASLIFAIGGSFIFAWIVWCATGGTKIVGISVPYYTSYVRDFIGGVDNFETLAKIIGINAFMLLLTSIPLVSLGIAYEQAQNILGQNLIVISLIFITLVFLVIVRGFLRHMRKGFRLLHIYVLLYLGLHLLWPYMPYDRFVVPILPFLLLFLITELGIMADLARKELISAPGRQIGRKVSSVFVSLFLLVMVSVGSYQYATGIYQSIVAKRISSRRALEDRQVFQWISANTDPADVLICYRDPQYFLYTGRKAVRSFAPRSLAQNQNDEPAKVISRIIDESRGQYLILTSSDFEQEYQSELVRKTYEDLIHKFPEIFIPEFRSEDGRTAIYSIQRHDAHTKQFS